MLLLLALLTLPCGAPRYSRCVCVPAPEPRTISEMRAALTAKKVVFSGRVLSLTDRHDSTRVLNTITGDSIWFPSWIVVAWMVPETVWYGRVGDTVAVETNLETSACGASLQAGKHYLIDAEPEGDESVLATSKCQWTRPRSAARRLEALLRAASPRVAPAAATAHDSGDEDPRRFEPEIRAFEAHDRATPPAVGGIVFVGSSSIKNWVEVAKDFPGRSVLNRGFGGATLADVRYYEDRVVVRYKPRLVVLYAGDNDLAMGRSPERVLRDYRAFVAHLRRRQPETRLVYVSIKPSPARRALLAAARRTNELIRSEIRHDSLASYVDVSTPMLDPRGRPRAALFGPDSLHMNRSGYLLWRTLLDSVVH